MHYANVNQPPYSAVGLLATRIGGNWYTGTGALISPTQIVTCAHNLYSRTEVVAATEVCFYPAWDAPFPVPPGGIAAAAAFYAAGYAGLAANIWDVGFVELAVPVELPFFFKPRVTDHQIIDQDVHVTGYPGTYGGHMADDIDQVSGIYVPANLMSYTNDTWSGSSGGPVWTYFADDDVVFLRGIHTSVDDGTLKQGRLMTQAVFDWIELAKLQLAPNPFAVQAL
jgi:V8-like Glu-specific endopeptidase